MEPLLRTGNLLTICLTFSHLARPAKARHARARIESASVIGVLTIISINSTMIPLFSLTLSHIF